MYKVVSGFTLGFFNSTGWYISNYEMQQRMYWGRNKGCDFLEKSCKGTVKYREFCESPRSEGECSFDYASPSYCKDGTFEDGCKTMFPYNRNGNILECTNSYHNFGDKIRFEYYGPLSSCVHSSVQLKASPYVASLIYRFFFFLLNKLEMKKKKMQCH